MQKLREVRRIPDAIDVSKWQGTVDWAAVKRAGICHAMLRAGYGSNGTDPQFARNATQCEKNGIHWGAYWYSYATTPAAARQEARRCLQVLAGRTPELPVAYDIEYEPGILALDNGARTALVQAFLGEVEAAGYYGILYASTDFIRNRLNWKELSRYDVWAAQYGAACTCPLPYGIWQYSSQNALGIPGFGHALDCNRVYKDYPAIIRAAGCNGFSAPQTDTDRKPAAQRQCLTIGPVSGGDAWTLQQRCKALGLTEQGLYHSSWADEAHRTQLLSIGPVSSGDAWQLMRCCETLGLTAAGLYRSRYV